MNKIMYEVNWHYMNNGKGFTHCSVTPITVTREDILPGCSAISITAIDHEGREFHGCPENYFNTEQEAWDATKQCLDDKIEQLKTEIKDMQLEVGYMTAFMLQKFFGYIEQKA